LRATKFESERRGIQSLERSQNNSADKIQNTVSSRISHRNQGIGLAFSVMSTADEISAKGGGSWDGIEMQEFWLAKLGSWSDALDMYKRKLEESPENVEALLGCMKCLDARGEWIKVLDLARKRWDTLSSIHILPKDHKKAVRFCAQAAWRLEHWVSKASLSMV